MVGSSVMTNGRLHEMPKPTTVTECPVLEDGATMSLALQLARQARLAPPPNPAVGCVLALPDGTVLGVGATQRAGSAHAEVMALRDAAARGHDVRGATAWVTLEPCAHQGRTGPCCDALVAAGVAAWWSPCPTPTRWWPARASNGLRAAGVPSRSARAPSNRANSTSASSAAWSARPPGCGSRWRPRWTAKPRWSNGASQWITSPEARADGHAWRARAGAVLTGIGTVLEDNPRLDVRLVETPRQPALVVVDSRLETPLDAKLFIPGRPVFIYGAFPTRRRQAALEARGATVIQLPGPGGKVDLAPCCGIWPSGKSMNCMSRPATSSTAPCVREGLVDELLVYLAPKLLGHGPRHGQPGPSGRPCRGRAAGVPGRRPCRARPENHGPCGRARQFLAISLRKWRNELVAELAAGRMVILVDEEDRENEGDLVLAAEHVTPEAINFMARIARGLICLTLTRERCERLHLPPMASRNGTKHGTAFTVSIEAATGVTTGISAADRARTVQVAVAARRQPPTWCSPATSSRCRRRTAAC
jgi:diaminohydroxyphosphoribosylaminopyrimidine deaminase/5-amino-6-(5-phosphoribosylamino)uracil reductase